VSLSGHPIRQSANADFGVPHTPVARSHRSEYAWEGRAGRCRSPRWQVVWGQPRMSVDLGPVRSAVRLRGPHGWRCTLNVPAFCGPFRNGGASALFSPSTDVVSTAVAVPYVSRHGKPPSPTPPLQSRPMATPRHFPHSPLYLLAFGTSGFATRGTSRLPPLGSSLLRPVARAGRRLQRWERHLGCLPRQQAPTLQRRRPR